MSASPGAIIVLAVHFDSHGWASDPVPAFSANAAFTLFSPDETARVDIAQLAHKARTFFATALEIDPVKAYPEGRMPESDALHIEIKKIGQSILPPTRVYVVTFPLLREPHFRNIGDAAALAIGGAGMDSLVARTKRIWQVSKNIESGDDSWAPLRIAAILAAVLLAPIVPPEANTIFGVKGARERLERAVHGKA